MTKLCINCKHYLVLPYAAKGIEYVCKILPITDLVTGAQTYQDCYDMRKAEGACGARGELFESKGFEKND